MSRAADSQGAVTPSDHAIRRYHQRATRPALSDVPTAWHDAHEIDVDRAQIDGHEARFNPTHQLVLVRKDTQIVTCIDSTTARPAIKDAIKAAGWHP